jgi:N,N'-diacetyllegionaminate synthase
MPARKRTLLVAEIGINHNGDMELAEAMIRAAKDAGADAVKFQNYQTEDFLSDHSLKYRYQSQGREVEESQFAMFKRCELTNDHLRLLKKHSDDAGILFFGTPTNSSGVDSLCEIGSAYLKNGSDYLGHLPLIRHMARSGLHTILSTGMATQDEIDEAVEAFRTSGGADLTLLACTSSYPTPAAHANLRKITALAERYGCAAGFSDHTEGWVAAAGAVCLGATLIEKHFTTDRTLPGPDQWFSSDPVEFAELVRRVREMETLLGSSKLDPTPAEAHARKEYRLSCVAAHDLASGHVLSVADIAFRRPAGGLPPSQFETLVGKALRTPLGRGETFNLEQLTTHSHGQ